MLEVKPLGGGNICSTLQSQVIMISYGRESMNRETTEYLKTKTNKQKNKNKQSSATFFS